MTASLVFQLSNMAALLGWLILTASILLNRPVWRDFWAGQLWPLALSALYAVLIVGFFFKAPGGFDSLENMQLLFATPWVALAGWVHYLAFDLFVGAWISKRIIEEGLPRLLLLVLLPLTFMFGPAGYLAFHICRLAFSKVEVSQ